jgi:hypothetical protein
MDFPGNDRYGLRSHRIQSEKMKYAGSVLICLLFLLATSCAQKAKKAEIIDVPDIPSDWRLLDGDDYRIRYPSSGWEVRNDLSGARFCLLSAQTSPDDLFRDNVNLVVEPLTKELSIDQYVSLSVNKIGDKYKIREQKKYRIGGQEYFHLDLIGADRLHVSLNIFLKDKNAYVLTFTYEANESEKIKSEGDQIIKSFRFR